MRGFAGDAETARPLRDRDAAHALSRPQRPSRAAETSRKAGGRGGDRAGVGRRHALISDPGFKLVREASAAGHAVTVVPGASSVLAALSVAALPTDRFYFEGFLPPKEGARRNRLKDLVAIDATLVLFESGTRLADTLRDLSAAFGAREAAICRELTKLHEECRRGLLPQLAAEADGLETRGEFVIVVGPPAADAQRMSAVDLDDLLRNALRTQSVKDAVATAAELSGRPKREVYARALELSKSARPHEQD
ncbi:MAG: SAM-dependent methyltransferase [Xanthobacteraceae bacterium]